MRERNDLVARPILYGWVDVRRWVCVCLCQKDGDVCLLVLGS